MRLPKHLKGGDAGRFGYEYFAFLGAIEDISPITARTMRGKLQGERMDYAVERFFDSSCRRVVIKCDPSPELKREGRRIRSHNYIL